VRLSFVATDGGFDTDEYVTSCGVVGEGHYLTFQRSEESLEDWGLYLEYDDQSYGAYESSHYTQLNLAMRPFRVTS